MTRPRANVLRSGSSIVAFLAMLAVHAPGAQASASERGTLFIVGGGTQPPALVQQFVDLAGGAGRAKVVIFAMASVDGKKSGESKARDLRALGAEARNVWVSHAQADTDAVAQVVNEANAVWLGGGDQARLMAVLRGTRTEAAIQERYLAGAVIGGTSAGAAVMSAVMITGDERHPDADRHETKDSFTTIARDNVITVEGLALIGDAIVDQHFVRRKRHNRLVTLLLEREPRLGVGIDEGTALIVHPDGHWSVSGASVAVVYDARGATVTSGVPALGASDIRMHVLPAGSTFDPKTGTARLAP